MEQADVLPVLSTPGSVLHNRTQDQAMEKLLLETVNKVFFLQQEQYVQCTQRSAVRVGNFSQNLASVFTQ